MKLSNKYIIGCHVMFYEIDIVEEYLESVHLALEEVDNKDNVKVEMMWNLSQYFEEAESSTTMYEIRHKIESLGMKYHYITNKFYEQNDKPYTMADYRRELNNQCNECDYIIWGESDCLMPRQMFGVLEQLKEYANGQGVHRYITTFGIRKMWDESWKVLEHPEFTNKPYYSMDTPEDTKLAESSPWSIRYTMSQREMDEVNSKTTDLDVKMINYPKFDGSGLVISSDLLRTGANIPPAVYMNGDDSSFLESCRLHMGDRYAQFVINNILKVHNRNHPNKRHYVKGEDQSKNTHFKRSTKNWYKEFNNVSKGNLSKLYRSQEPFAKKEFKEESK